MSGNDSMLSTIDHIVVLMLENRSFDSMLGFLYADSGNTSPRGDPFEGLSGAESNTDSTGETVSVYRIQASDENCYFMPGADPGEGFKNTNAQLFGTKSPAPSTPATNGGFLDNFEFTLTWETEEKGRVLPGTKASDIMGMFTPDLLPVLSGLARGYAVCDHWYASAPTETIPNRAFAAMATSQGHLGDDAKSYTAPSIFSRLTAKGMTWVIYGYDAPALTRHTVVDITHAPNSCFGEFKDFQAAAQAGTLPNFAFLEPQWGAHGNSQHPNYDVAKGEQFLYELYTTLVGSPAWEKTLLVITYDEHGGCYDHVAPPANAVAPDSSAGDFGFDFTRFGVRVPAVLVSPRIAAGTVFRPAGWAGQDGGGATPFDHTSILATIEKRWGLASLTARDAAAPDIGGVLTLATPRTDDPLAGVVPPASAPTSPLPDAPSHLENVLAESAATLPTSDPRGERVDHEPLNFASGSDALAFARQRTDEYFGQEPS